MIIYIDGLCEPHNPNGTASYGFVVYDGDKKIYEEAKVVGHGKGMSNNVGEYAALCAALDWLLKHGFVENILVMGDSQLVINQMNGDWGCNGGMYVNKYHEALHLSKSFRNLRFEWIPREKNTEADSLSKKAYAEYCLDRGVEPKYGQHGSRGSKSFKPGENSCINCMWVRASGPHIGCYQGGVYQKWLPKAFAMQNHECCEKEGV